MCQSYLWTANSYMSSAITKVAMEEINCCLKEEIDLWFYSSLIPQVLLWPSSLQATSCCVTFSSWGQQHKVHTYMAAPSLALTHVRCASRTLAPCPGTCSKTTSQLQPVTSKRPSKASWVNSQSDSYNPQALANRNDRRTDQIAQTQVSLCSSASWD